jgi:hypothetical protein
VLLTCLIKVITWPLTAIQMKAAKKMQKFAKPMQDIREKHKENPEKMQKELMKLYPLRLPECSGGEAGDAVTHAIQCRGAAPRRRAASKVWRPRISPGAAAPGRATSVRRKAWSLVSAPNSRPLTLSPTISGSAAVAIRPPKFCETIGITKNNSLSDVALLEHAVRDDLNKTSSRFMAVLDPVRLVIENAFAAVWLIVG